MKGKRGDVADRHMLAVSGVYCVCADAGASRSIVLPHTGAHERGTDSMVWGKGGVHTHTHTHFGWKPRLFQHRLCVSLAVCQPNQAESDCGIVGFYLQFPASSHAHMNTYRIIQAKHVYYSLHSKFIFSLSLSLYKYLQKI